MSVYDRAAQFSPFAALTGHAAAIRETARLTEDKVELEEDARAYLDECLQRLRIHLKEQPRVTLSYFEADESKAGGRYQSLTGVVKKIDEFRREMILEDGKQIPLDNLVEIQMG
ncbi:MAG: YolD-like family protein [Roseburia sp.]|nr:YolD-like family protein [Roseburia sp.]